MLCQNSGNRWTHFDQILYCRPLLVLPACFTLFVRENQKLTFTNLKSSGNNRTNASELLRCAYISYPDKCVWLLSACELAFDHFVPVKQDRKHPSVLTDSGVPTLTLLEHLAQQWSGHAGWIEAMGTLSSDRDERAPRRVQHDYGTADCSIQLSRWASLKKCVTKDRAHSEIFGIGYYVDSLVHKLRIFQGEALRNVGIYLRVHTASQPRTTATKYSLLMWQCKLSEWGHNDPSVPLVRTFQACVTRFLLDHFCQQNCKTL
jgi:hypothetical protein